MDSLMVDSLWAAIETIQNKKLWAWEFGVILMVLVLWLFFHQFAIDKLNDKLSHK